RDRGLEPRLDHRHLIPDGSDLGDSVLVGVLRLMDVLRAGGRVGACAGRVPRQREERAGGCEHAQPDGEGCLTSRHADPYRIGRGGLRPKRSRETAPTAPSLQPPLGGPSGPKQLGLAKLGAIRYAARYRAEQRNHGCRRLPPRSFAEVEEIRRALKNFAVETDGPWGEDDQQGRTIGSIEPFAPSLSG